MPESGWDNQAPDYILNNHKDFFQQEEDEDDDDWVRSSDYRILAEESVSSYRDNMRKPFLTISLFVMSLY